MPSYTKGQVLDKIQMAERFLLDSRKALNVRMEVSELCSTLQCLAAAHGMLKEIYKPIRDGVYAPKQRELPRCPTCGRPEDVTIDEKGKMHIRRR